MGSNGQQMGLVVQHISTSANIIKYQSMTSKEEKGNSRLSKEEKEKLVLKLLKENKTWRQITHLGGVSPNFISNTN